MITGSFPKITLNV